MQVATDVTVRKQAEEKLNRVNEERKKRVAEKTAGILKANDALRQEVKERKRAEAMTFGRKVRVKTKAQLFMLLSRSEIVFRNDRGA